MKEVENVRLDKWLWAARFFKTRSLAATAVRNGQIDCNGNRPKPSRIIKPGDTLQIKRGDEHFQLSVVVCVEKRLSAALAANLYEESSESQQARAAAAELRRAAYHSAPMAPQGRPDKRARGKIRSFRGK